MPWYLFLSPCQRHKSQMLRHINSKKHQMRSILCLLVILFGTCIQVFSQKTWITFTDPNPSPPQITVHSSTNQTVRLTLSISGMYSENIVVDTTTYQRLTVPKMIASGEVGSPELPAISKRIAIPECGSYSVSYMVADSVVLSDYLVYPAPEMVEDTLTGTISEQFAINDSIYQQNAFMPVIAYNIPSEGYLRNQRWIRGEFFPIRYNPVSRQIIAYTLIDVTITFNNSVGPVNIENGLFNSVCNNAFLNFNMEDKSLPPYPVLDPGMVEWLEITDTAQAVNIDADYLIIADNQFVNPHSPALQMLANHRSDFNGFKVTVVSAQNIINYPFQYSIEQYKEEQKIRSFIKRVYDGKHALHTYDGRVAFVLLVGDADNTDFTHGVPASYDPNPTGTWENNQWNYYCYNDYYYSCVTPTSVPIPGFDDVGDLYIGRICAVVEAELNFAVFKTKKYETEIWSGVTQGAWRERNVLAYGLGGDIFRNCFCTIFKNKLEQICPPDYQTVVIDGDNTSWNDDYVDYINQSGAKLVIDFGHGTKNTWCRENYQEASDGALTLNYKKEYLNNSGQWPFAIVNACNTGLYVGMDGKNGGIGEAIQVYDQYHGYVASIADVHWVSFAKYDDPAEFPKYIYECIPYALYNNLSSMLGECTLEGRLISNNTLHYGWNLFGDPALNLSASGYELSHDVTLSGITDISVPVHVLAGTTLTFSPGSEIDFQPNGQLIIEDGAKLVIGNSTKIKGQSEENKILVYGEIEGYPPNPPDPAPMQDVEFSALTGTSWKGLEIYNPDLQVVIKNGSLISDCNISGEFEKLDLTLNTSLVNSSIELNQTGFLIDDCSLTNSNIQLTNDNLSLVDVQILNSSFQSSSSDAMIRIEHIPTYTVSNCTIYYGHGTGIDVLYSGNYAGQHLIQQNIIQKSGTSSDLSWGIKVYYSSADIKNNLITNNRYGVATLNQSQVQLSGNPFATQQSETQNIINNYQNQIRANDNSFPYYCHYNYIQNTPDGATYLIYYNSGIPGPPPPIDNTFNIKCNHFDDNFNPSLQLYPTGWYDYSIWDPGYTCIPTNLGGEDFDMAISSMDSGNYTLAESQFKSVIETYPESLFAKESAKKLLPIKQLSDQNFTGLMEYFDTITGLKQDSSLNHLIYRLKNKCHIEMENYPAAITWFENDIQTPSSEEDSLYSLIDLSDTYILMTADSNLKSSNTTFTGSLTQYKPKNRAEYQSRRKEWIDLLFKDDMLYIYDSTSLEGRKMNAIKQIVPNPFSSSLKAEFALSTGGTIDIIVTNLVGQEVKRISKTYQTEGNYSETIDLTGHPDGLYLITLTSNKTTIGRITAVKTK